MGIIGSFSELFVILRRLDLIQTGMWNPVFNQKIFVSKGDPISHDYPLFWCGGEGRRILGTS